MTSPVKNKLITQKHSFEATHLNGYVINNFAVTGVSPFLVVMRDS